MSAHQSRYDSAAPGYRSDLASGERGEREKQGDVAGSRIPWARLQGENSSVHPRSHRFASPYIEVTLLLRTLYSITFALPLWPNRQPRTFLQHARRTIIKESRRAMSLPVIRRNDLWLGKLFHLGSLPTARLPSTIRSV